MGQRRAGRDDGLPSASRVIGRKHVDKFLIQRNKSAKTCNTIIDRLDLCCYAKHVIADITCQNESNVRRILL